MQKRTDPMSTKTFLSVNEIQEIFNLTKRLLDKKLLNYLNDLFDKTDHDYSDFPYDSYSEILNLVVICLLRELLQSDNIDNKLFPATFMKEIQEFIKKLFLSGQTELQQQQKSLSKFFSRYFH